MESRYIVYGTLKNKDLDEIVGSFQSTDEAKTHNARTYLRGLSKSKKNKYEKFVISKVIGKVTQEQLEATF